MLGMEHLLTRAFIASSNEKVAAENEGNLEKAASVEEVIATD